MSNMTHSDDFTENLESSKPGMKVLIVDDSRSQLELTRLLLQDWGFEVVAVANGAAAIQAFLSDSSLQLAIVDWEMPEVDGLKVIQEIKASGRFMYAVMVTARSGKEDLERAFAAGADDFIPKPFQPAELRARLTSGRRLVEGQLQLLQAQKLESIGRLAAGVAHEINTPAQYVSDNLSFLGESFSELSQLLKTYQALHAEAMAGGVSASMLSEVTELAKKIDVEYLIDEIPRSLTQSSEGMDRVTTIVRAMKEFSHPGSKEKKPIDLNHAIEATVAVTASEWKYVADLETDFDQRLPLVPAHAVELNQVILNTVVNAAQALSEKSSEEKGHIRIRTLCEGTSWAVMEISDTGVGIPEEARSKIFDPFFTTKEVGKGTGQGLAIAHSIVVDKHGGTIEVESAVGVGTTFRFRLPLK